MLNFAQLSEILLEAGNGEHVPLQIDNGGSRSAVVVSKDMDFWTKFAELLQTSPDAFSEVLDLPVGKITPWQSKIYSAMQTAKEIQDEKSRETMIPTGTIPL